MTKEKDVNKKNNRRQSLQALIIQLEAKVQYSTDPKAKSQKMKVAYFSQHNFVAIFKPNILTSLNSIQLPDFVYHINEIEKITLITDKKKVELFIKGNTKITIQSSKQSPELNDWYENIDRNLKLINGFYQLNEKPNKLILKYQTASVYEYKHGKNTDMISVYQEYLNLRPFQFFQEVIKTQNNELSDHYWFGNLRKSQKKLKSSITSVKNKQKSESNQKYFAFLLTSKPKIDYAEVSFENYPYYFSNVIDNSDLPEWIDLNFLYLFKIKNKKIQHHYEVEILPYFELISQVQQIELVESSKEFVVDILYVNRQISFNFDCASFALQFYQWMKFSQNCFIQQINSLGGTIKKNADIFLDESKKMYFDDIIRKILINKQQKSFKEKNFLGTIALQTITALQKEILLPFFCQNEQDIKSFKLNIKKINDLYLESLKEKIHDIEENELAYLYDYLVELNKHIKLLNFYKLDDRRFEIAFNCLLNNFKKLFFNRAAELMSQILDRLLDNQYLVDPNTKQKTYKIYVDFFKELNQFLSEFDQFKNFKVYNILKAEFIRKIFFFFFNHFRYIFKNNPSLFQLEDYIALLSGIQYGNDQVQSLSENLFLKKFLQNYKMLFYNIASELMIETKKHIDKIVAQKLKNLNIEIFSIRDILNFQLKEINDMLDYKNNVYHQNIQKYLIIKILEGFILEVEKQDKDWLKENFKDKIKTFREYFDDMGEKQFCQFNKFLLYYYKFIITSSEDNANMYLGMMPTILGEFLSEDIIKSMIDTKQGDFFGIQKLKYKIYYDSLLSEQNKGEQRIKNQRKYKKKIRRNLYLLYIAARFIKFSKDSKKRIYFRQKQQEKKVNKKVAQRNFDIGTLNNDIEVLFLHNDQFAINSSEQNFEIIKKKLINAQFTKLKICYEAGLLNFYNKDHKIVKSLFAAKIKSVQKNSFNDKQILVLSYTMNFRVVLQSQKNDQIEKVQNDLQNIIDKLNKILINDKKIIILKEQEVQQNVQFFLNMFCAQGYILIQPKIIPTLDEKFYPNYKTFEFLLPEQMKAWSEKHPQNFISQRTFFSKPNTLRNRRKPSIKNLFEDSNLRSSSMSQNDNFIGLQQTKNHSALGYNNSQIKGLLSKNELTSKNQQTSNIRKISMSENYLSSSRDKDRNPMQTIKYPKKFEEQLQLQIIKFKFAFWLQQLNQKMSSDIQLQDLDIDYNKRLGKGYIAEVFRAKHKVNGKYYAVKIAHPEEKIALQREIKIQKALNHRNIVKLYNSEEKESKLYIILEYIRGGALFDYLMKHEYGFKEKQALDYFKQMTKAIEYLHKNKILHRDLKPENILIDKKGLIKLCDFGFTAFFGDQVRITKCGTREYMAPEIFQNKEQDLSVDVWSLGILLFELTHKATPFPLSVLMQFREAHKTFKIPFKKDLSQEIKILVIQILQNNPKKRLTAQQILDQPLIKSVQEESFHLEKMGKKHKKNNSQKPKKKENQKSVNKNQNELKVPNTNKSLSKHSNSTKNNKNTKSKDTQKNQSKKQSVKVDQKIDVQIKNTTNHNIQNNSQLNQKNQKLRYLLENNKKNQDKPEQNTQKLSSEPLNVRKIEKNSSQHNTVVQLQSQKQENIINKPSNNQQQKIQENQRHYIQKEDQKSQTYSKNLYDQHHSNQHKQQVTNTNQINYQNQQQQNKNDQNLIEAKSKLNLEPRRQVAYAKSSNRNINIYSLQQQNQKPSTESLNIQQNKLNSNNLRVLQSQQNIQIHKKISEQKSKTPVRRSSSRKVKISLSLQKQTKSSPQKIISNGTQQEKLNFKQQVRKFNDAKKKYYKIKDYNFNDHQQKNDEKQSPFKQLYHGTGPSKQRENMFATGQKNIYNKLEKNNSDQVNRSLHSEPFTERKVPLFPIVYESLKDNLNNNVMNSQPNLNQNSGPKRIKYTLEADPQQQRVKYQSTEKYSYKVTISQQNSSIKKKIKNDIEETYNIRNVSQQKIESRQPRVYSTEQVRDRFVSTQNVRAIPSLQQTDSNQQVARTVKKFNLDNYSKVKF